MPVPTTASTIPNASSFVRTQHRKIIIRPTRGWIALQLGELWEYRELLYFLVWRDVKVRYKQTFLGVGWAVLQPLLTMVIFSVVFGNFAKIPSDGIPYPIFSYVALLPWNFFAGALGRAGNSLVNSANLIRKVYFPRLVVPIAATLAGLIDFLVAFVILIGMMLYYGIHPTVMIWTLPFFTILAVVSALAMGLWLAALNVKYRDVAYLIPFLVQIWMYASPVVYPVSLVPERWRIIFALNPMTGVIEGFRAALLGTPSFDWLTLIPSIVIVIILLVSGALYFRRTEKTFADVV